MDDGDDYDSACVTGFEKYFYSYLETFNQGSNQIECTIRLQKAQFFF